MPTFGSLFAGIGGIDLGLERAGWECRWQVEWDEFCQHNLGHHWRVPMLGDVAAVDWRGVERVDLLAGGFPCQPFSFAGKQRGVDDERWLWPEFARAIRVLRPRYVLVENVPGLLARRGGMGHVIGDLAALGYLGEWDSIPASAVGAPHLRYRVFVVAYANGEGEPGRAFDGFKRPRIVVEDTDGGPVESRWRRRGAPEASELADPDLSGRNGRSWELGPGRWREPSDGSWWRTEPDVGRVAHGVPARVDRLRALGNAVVPQVVEVIGRRLMELAEQAA